MANIQKLTYPYFTDNETRLEANTLNPIIQKINDIIEKVNGGVTPTQTVAKPTISISGTTATITCSTSGATIYYTTNGNTPTTSSTQYSSPITLSGACTIKAIAVKSGMNNSQVASEDYNPSATVQPPTIIVQNSAIIMKAESGAEIRYTTNGSTPTSSSTLYTHAFTSESNISSIKAIAIKNGSSSSVASASFTAPTAQVTPTIVIEDGKLMIFARSTDTIYYSIDSSALNVAYSEPVTLSGSCYIQARTKDSGDNYSSVVKVTWDGTSEIVTEYYASKNSNARIVRSGSSDTNLRLATSASGKIRFYPITQGNKYQFTLIQSTAAAAYYGYCNAIPSEIGETLDVVGKMPTQDASQSEARTFTINSAENYSYLVLCNGNDTDSSVEFYRVIS